MGLFTKKQITETTQYNLWRIHAAIAKEKLAHMNEPTMLGKLFAPKQEKDGHDA